MFALVPLAHAIPPDPLWITGIYDDADFDEVVIAVTTTHTLVNQAFLLVGNPVLSGCVQRGAVASTPPGILSSVVPRGPPA
jgi:hypothetical protein